MHSHDARFSYLLRTTVQNSTGLHPIVLRITFRGVRKDIFTGLHCPKKDWNSKAGRLVGDRKTNLPINQELEQIISQASYCYNALRFSGEEFSIDQLVNKIRGKDITPNLLMDFINEAVIKMKKRVGAEITKATFYKYKKSLEYTQDYVEQECRSKNYLLARVNTSFLENYFYFLRNSKNIANNSALKYLSFLKVLLGPAIRSRIIKDDPFRELKFRAKPVHRGFLTHKEIKTIEELELQNEDLERKRDIFLFSCYSGLAYVDLRQLTRHHIIKDQDGSHYIRKPRQKTGEESIIPLLPAAERILLKYSPTEDIRDFSWYISTNQKMNLGLKYIGEKAKIEKVLHMHLARHTFATTITLANGVPLETVSKMLGHANIRQTQLYAKVVGLKIKNDMQKIKRLFQ